MLAIEGWQSKLIEVQVRVGLLIPMLRRLSKELLREVLKLCASRF